MRLPQPLEGAPGLFVVDAAWGTINPLRLAEGPETIGELELVEHLQLGRPLVDTRSEESYERASIPGAINMPPSSITGRIEEFDREVPTALFCNGPQCPASPNAIHELLDLGHPAGALLYYRGGMHDWVTLGYPTAPEL